MEKAKLNNTRRSTDIATGRIMATMEEDLKQALEPGTLWKSIRHKNMKKNIRDFWWKACHDALRIGTFWEKLDGYEQRLLCSHCGVTESLEHILVDCEAPGQSILWNELNQVAKEKGLPNYPITYGSILGSPAASLKHTTGKNTPVTDRFYNIVIPETAHLIWKLRC